MHIVHKSFFAFLLVVLSYNDASFVQNAWPDSLNTAKDAAYLSDTEKEVILEMNKVRSNPARYAQEYIQPLLATFSGMDMLWPGDDIKIGTREGDKAVQECYRVLLKEKAVALIYPSIGMSKAAADHANYQEKTGKMGHFGENNSDPEKRMDKYGQWEITIGENISYGCNTAAKIVRGLLIDDGVSNRGHRINTLAPSFRVVGVAIAKHPKYGDACVINLAGSFTEKK